MANPKIEQFKKVLAIDPNDEVMWFGLGRAYMDEGNFEEAAQDVTEEDMMKAMVCGNDPKRFIEAVQEYVDAGFDHVYAHQIGPDQEGFIDFFAKKVMPEFQREKVR